MKVERWNSTLPGESSRKRAHHVTERETTNLACSYKHRHRPRPPLPPSQIPHTLSSLLLLLPPTYCSFVQFVCAHCPALGSDAGCFKKKCKVVMVTVWGKKVRGAEKARRCSVRCAVPVGLSKQGNERTYILFYCCLNFQINTRSWIRRACWATCNLFFFFTALTDFGAPKFWRPWIGAHFTLVDVWPCQYWDSFFC